MLKNYIKIASRNILRQKVFSLINICGLALGIAAFWLMILFVADELSYDSYHVNASRIYRVVQNAKWSEGGFNFTGTSAQFAPALKKDFAEVEEAIRIDIEGAATLGYLGKYLKVADIFITDSTFFKVFSYRFLYGDASSALNLPNGIVLTKSLAIKLFGNTAKAYGKLITTGKGKLSMVTAIIEDVPANSHFTFSALRPFPDNYTEAWGNFHLYTYIMLNEKDDITSLNAKLPGFFERYLKEMLSDGLDDLTYRIDLQPVKSIHLYSNVDKEMSINGSITIVYVIAAIAFLILLIAIINYINLSIARSFSRVKEIGIRKVSGSGKLQLIYMFLTESVLITLIAVLTAICIIIISLPFYNELTGKDLNTLNFDWWKAGIMLFSFTLFTGIFAGIYPALLASGFKLIPALKGQSNSLPASINFRKSLVVFQFVITVCMISATIIMQQQLRYLGNKDLGINKDQVLTFNIEKEEMQSQLDLIKQKLKQNPSIESVASAGNAIGTNILSGVSYQVETSDGSMSIRPAIAVNLVVDQDFIPTIQADIIEGRNFSDQIASDKETAFIINETLARKSGWKVAVGKKIQSGAGEQSGSLIGTVIGIVKDFHYSSLQNEIAPLLLRMHGDYSENSNIYVRVSNKNIPESISHIQRVYQELDPENPFEYHFLNDNFAKQYRVEQKQGRLLVLFTGLAITIASLGLIGLVGFAVIQRTREIGIRKVLGASVTQITNMLPKEFLKLVLIACVIAFPLSWWAMNKWLQDFAYRIGIEWWVFALAGMLAVLIALVTISFQAIKAAIANPVKSLRSE